MKSENIIFYLVFIAFITSCKKEDIGYNYFFKGKKVGEKKIKFKTIDVDTLIFGSIESSYNGNILINDGKLMFLDKQFGYIFEFNQKGQLLSKKMGQGEGPKEINTTYIDGYLKSKNKNHIFVGSSIDIHIHDEFETRNISFYLNWGDKIGQEKINSLKEYSGSENSLYGFEYENLIIREDNNNNVYIPIQSFYDNFNSYTEDYYKKSRILVKIDLKKRKVVKIIGRRSPEYLKYKYIGHHSFFSFDIDKSNNFHISHEIDSLIYVYNSRFDNIYSYGNKGTNMDTNYMELYKPKRKNITEAYMEDRPKRGYYTNIEYFHEFNILFRSYKKGENSKYDGLQIYKGTTLIADVEVPKNLNWVKGYIAPYFYSNAILNEDDLILKSYRFRIPEELLKNK